MEAALKVADMTGPPEDPNALEDMQTVAMGVQLQLKVRWGVLADDRVELEREWVKWVGEQMKWEGVAAVRMHLEVGGAGMPAVGVHMEVGRQQMEGKGAGSAELGHSGSEPDRVLRTPRSTIRRRGCCSNSSCPLPTRLTGRCMRR